MQKLFGYLLCLLTLLIPFDYRYDKWCRHFSLKLIPEELILPVWYEKKLYFYPSDILAILLFFLALYAFRIPFRKMVFDYGALWLIALFFLCFFSIVASPLYTYPVAYFRLIQLLTPILLFVSVAAAGRESMNRVLWCLCIGGSVQAILAIGQYFLQEPLGLYFLGELKQSHQAGGLPCPNGARWLLDHLFGTYSDGISLRRASGTFNHSNPLGSFLLISIFSSFVLFKTKPRTVALCLILMIFALILTFSRSAFFACLLGTCIYFFKTRENPSNFTLRWIVGLSFLVSCLLFSEQILQRGGIFNYNDFVSDSDSIRKNQNKLAFKIIATHPLVGVGYQQFTYAPEWNDFNAKEAVTMVHNSLFLVAAESGLLAAFCLVGFFFFTFKSGLQKNSEMAALGLSVGFAFCVIANCDFYPFLFQHAKMSLFLILGLFRCASKSPAIVNKRMRPI